VTPSPRLDLALRAAREAASLILGYYRRGVDVVRKPDDSPVTRADREAEALIRRRIREAFPGDAVLGEEEGETPGDSGWRWILDPIDGTRTFIRGVPLFGTLIGAEHEGRPVLGVALFPALNEVVFAEQGGGAWTGTPGGTPVPARVSSVDRLDASLVCFTALEGFAGRGLRPNLDALLAAAGMSRTWGDCYGYLLVATGRAEVMLDPAMHVWDCAALLPILEEAGGTFTDWSGAATIHATRSVATNRRVLPAVLAALQRDASR